MFHYILLNMFCRFGGEVTALTTNTETFLEKLMSQITFSVPEITIYSHNSTPRKKTKRW